MDSIKRYWTYLSTRPSILTLAVWLIAMVITYSIIAIRIDRIKDKIRESGIEITLKSSKLVNLALLENDVQQIHTLLLNATKGSDVIYASVVDHRKKVVAFTGVGHLLPAMTGARRSIENVSIWEGEFKNYPKILNFASEITYGGTKIGEFFVGLSATEGLRLRNRFIIVTVSSGLVLLSVISILYFRSIRSILVKLEDFRRTNSVMASIPEKPRVTCPLCGTQKPLSNRVFSRPKLDRLLIIEASKYEPGDGEPADSKGINLSQLAERKDLSWIKRRVISRCTEIIRKLAV